MIYINNVTKTYQNGESRLSALDKISVEIRDNEFAVVLGPSGSGKSTLLNTVSGLEKVDSGSIKYDNTEICGLNDRELTKFRRENIAFVFQAYHLLSLLNVEANIKMGASLAGVGDVADIIEAVGLSGKEKRLPRQLSGGEQQRVSIARALSKNPKVLFCDEPTGALDEATGRQILKYLLKLQKEKGFCILMVTHNVNIAQIATKVIKMNSGRIIEIIENKSPAEVDSIGW